MTEHEVPLQDKFCGRTLGMADGTNLKCQLIDGHPGPCLWLMHVGTETPVSRAEFTALTKQVEVSVPVVDQQFLDIAERCRAFLDLPENWNSYRSRRIDPVLLRSGLDLLSRLLRPGAKAPHVVPTACGGVQLEWHTPSADLEIEVREPGRYHVLSHSSGVESEFEVLDDLGELVRLVQALSPVQGGPDDRP